MCASPVPKTPGGGKSPSPDLGSKRTRTRVQRVVWDESDESDEDGGQSQSSIVPGHRVCMEAHDESDEPGAMSD